MAAKNNDVPPIPVPPPGAGVPPIEPAPAPPAPPAAPAAAEVPTPPAAAPNPYATPAPAGTPTAPAAPAQPYPAQPYGQQPYGQQGYTPPAAGPAQGLSVTSMVLGIGGLLLAFVGIGFLPALAAVITGHMAQKRQPWVKPFWLTGIITGYVSIGISLIFGALMLVFFIAAIASASYLG